MKIATLSFVVALLSTVSAHMDMQNPLPRGHPLNPNAAVKDFDCISAPLLTGCGNKAFPCGGYPPDTAVTQTFNAGQVFNVQFGNPSADPNNPGGNQARHNGGLCEFALSYDDGKSWSRIATYHNTCPDIFYQWPVKIPDNAPSCERCLLSWSWINNLGNREFYQNCADVKIVGSGNTPLPVTGITIANILGFEIMTPPGDPANTGNAKGSGPTQADIDANTKGASTSGPAIDNGGAGTGGDNGGEPAPEQPAPEQPAPEQPAPEQPAPEQPASQPPPPEQPAPEQPAPASQPAPESAPQPSPEPVPEPTPAASSPPSSEDSASLYNGRCIKKEGSTCVKRAPKCLKRRNGKCIKKEGKCLEQSGGKCVRRGPVVCSE